MSERLQKLMGQAGLCSRRKAEELILAGRVTVNGVTVTELGTKADPEKDHIKVDGKRLKPSANKVYLLLNKPKGYLCTLSDPQDRPKVTDLVKGIAARVFPVGRLDYSSEGLIILTNDGEFAHKINKAGGHCPKTYLTKVKGNPALDAIVKLSRGIILEGKRLAPCRIQKIKEGDNPWFSVRLTEGKNNQIRRMFDRIGHRVLKLKRIQIGFLRDPRLKPGEYRHLSGDEIKRLREMEVESFEGDTR